MVNKEPDEQKLEKYKDLYEYSKELLDEEQNRFRRIDQKASWYLSALTILVGFSSFFSNRIFEQFIPPISKLEWFLVILFFSINLCFILAWFMFFLTLKQHGVHRLSLNNEMLEFFRVHRRIDIHYFLAKKSAEAYENNRKITDKKAMKLAWGYRIVIIAILLMILFLASFIIVSWK